MNEDVHSSLCRSPAIDNLNTRTWVGTWRIMHYLLGPDRTRYNNQPILKIELIFLASLIIEGSLDFSD